MAGDARRGTVDLEFVVVGLRCEVELLDDGVQVDGDLLAGQRKLVGCSSAQIHVFDEQSG
jgi:hypothetical protein